MRDKAQRDKRSASWGADSHHLEQMEIYQEKTLLKTDIVHQMEVTASDNSY